jgi:3-keto-disaccharide hydrolase
MRRCRSPLEIKMLFVTLRRMRNFIFCFCLCLVTALSAYGAEIKIDFSDFSAGQTPTNFNNALAGGGRPGDWKIVMDEEPSAFAPLTPQAGRTATMTQRAVLAQVSQDPTDEHFPMLIYDGQTFKDFKLTTQFKIVSGVVEQMAGVVFRYQNASNFYVVRASALGRNLRFYKVVNGQRGSLIGPDLDISTNVWHTLTVQCQGNQITCQLDATAMPTLNDNTFPAGKVGFWTKSDAVSYFGDTTIDYTPIVPLAQTLVDDILKKQPRILELRIYTLDDRGQPRIIASKNEKEIGQPGTDAEKSALVKGAVFFGRGEGTVAVTMPLCDRNGNPVAAVRVQLKSTLFETQDSAVTRARMIVTKMQAQVASSQDLTQ